MAVNVLLPTDKPTGEQRVNVSIKSNVMADELMECKYEWVGCLADVVDLRRESGYNGPGGMHSRYSIIWSIGGG